MPTFTKANLEAYAMVGAYVGDQQDFWEFIYSEAEDDATAVFATYMLTRVAAGDTNLRHELLGIKEAIQELRAMEAKIRVSQVIQRPQGDVELVAEFEHLVP